MKLVKLTDDHYIVVDDSKIKEGDWYVHNQKGVGLRVQKCIGTNLPMDSKKITHSTQPLEDGTTIHGIEHKRWILIKYIDLQEVKELIGEVDVEKKAREKLKYLIKDNLKDNNHKDTILEQLDFLFKEKKYTEEQLIWAIQEAYGHGQDDEFDGVNKIEESIKAITEHLQPKTEWEVEWETIDNREPCDCSCHNNPNMIHFVACCNDGWIGKVTQKLKLK